MILSFYLLICVGLSPKLQTLWVETAMTTYTHKWLATSFISEGKINEIMAKNQVNDEGYETDISQITTTEKQAEKAVDCLCRGREEGRKERICYRKSIHQDRNKPHAYP